MSDKNKPYGNVNGVLWTAAGISYRLADWLDEHMPDKLRQPTKQTLYKIHDVVVGISSRLGR